jgi:hypothetical protein
VDWNNLDRVRDKERDVLKAVIKSKITQNADGILTASRIVSFSRRALLHRAS